MNTIDLERSTEIRNPPARSIVISILSLAARGGSRGLVLDWREFSHKTVEDTEPDQKSPISLPPGPYRPLSPSLFKQAALGIRELAGADPASPEFGRFRLIADGKLVEVTVREAGSAVILRLDDAGPAGEIQEILDTRPA